MDRLGGHWAVSGGRKSNGTEDAGLYGDSGSSSDATNAKIDIRRAGHENRLNPTVLVVSVIGGLSA
jgi:hypothetical protein